MINFRQILNLGGFRLTSLGTPTATDDAATKAYADLKVTKAGDTMSGPLAMGSSRITGLGTPTATTDAVTKAYADTKVTDSTAITFNLLYGGM